jgi:4-hydroxybenzoate polyprenyltransferase
MLAASQFAVGAFNDYCDADLDASAKPARPIPSGVVTRHGALMATVALLLAALSLAASFGPSTLGFALLGTGAGLAYDRLLKRTPWSWVPYVLGLPILPVWSWSTLGELPPAAGWAYPLGALLALALHLANALPDAESDHEASAGGLVQSLGRLSSLVILFLSFMLALAFGLVISYLAVGLQLRMLPILLGGIIGLVALALASRPATDRAAFPLLVASSALLATGIAAVLLA